MHQNIHLVSKEKIIFKCCLYVDYKKNTGMNEIMTFLDKFFFFFFLKEKYNKRQNYVYCIKNVVSNGRL